MASSTAEELDVLTRLACFGSEDGSYNVLDRDSLKSFVKAECAKDIATSKEKSLLAIQHLRTVFQKKYYLSKDPILFALACIIRNSNPSKDHVDDEVRTKAYELAQEMCQSARELFTFVHLDKCASKAEPLKAGWGRGMRSLISHYYESKTPLQLAQEVTKCKSSRGFTHRDLIRQCHLTPSKKGKGSAAVLGYLTHGKEELNKFKDEDDKELQQVVAYLNSVASLGGVDLTCEKEIVRSLVETHSLHTTQVPTQCFQIKESFEGLLHQMSQEETIRFVPKMAGLGMLDPQAPMVQKVIQQISDTEAIKANKISPVLLFNTQKRYEQNRNKKWIRNNEIVKTFYTAYNASLQNLSSTGKRYLLAIHVGSKTTKTRVLGSSWINPASMAAVITQMLLQSEDQLDVVFFNMEVMELKVKKDMPAVAILEQILNKTKEPTNDNFDLKEPLVWAANNRKPYDQILLLTDKKAVSSVQAFHQAIKQYRSSCVPESKVALVGLSDTTNLSEPSDMLYLDVSGFNETVPDVLHKFYTGMPELSTTETTSDAKAS